MDALSDLDGPVKRVESAADQAAAAAAKLEQAAARAERAAARVETDGELVRRSAPMQQVARPPIVEPPPDFDLPPPKLKSRAFGVILTILVLGGGVGFYMIYRNQQEAKAEQAKKADENRKKNDQLAVDIDKDQPDPGSIRVRSEPSQAGVWLKIGRAPVDTIGLSSMAMHELRVEGLDGYQAVDTQVIPSHWSGEKANRKATIVVPLKPVEKGKQAVKLPAMPPKPPEATGFTPGRGPIHIESQPAGAEVWLYVGMTDAVELSGIQAGTAYELRVLKDGHRPAYISITADEWRDGGNPNVPINRAKKKSVLEKSVTLEPDAGEKAEKPDKKVDKKPEKKGG